MKSCKQYLVAYDMIANRKRAKVAEILKSCGFRVQKSVYECRLSAVGYGKLIEKLAKLIDRRRDSLIIYPMCSLCVEGKQSLGIKSDVCPREFMIL